MNRFNKIFAATFLLTVLMFPIVLSGRMMPVIAGFTDPSSWYASRTGVLSTEKNLVDLDTGLAEGLGILYPFENDANLAIGFSKFGEFVNPYAGPLGVKYRAREIFTRDVSIVPMENWLNGWLIEIAYKSTLHSPSDRFVWAFALFADGTVAGGDWATVPGSDGGGLGIDEVPVSGTGGRQTNALCRTEDIRWLQDGPRRSVAVLVTHVFDVNLNPTTGAKIGSEWPVVDIFFTIIFNKDKKEIIIIKDLCYRLPAKEPPADIKFSNREQVDLGSGLGTPPDIKSWAHFWHQKFSTCYGANFLKTKWILRENHDTIQLGETETYKVGDIVLLDCPKKTGKPAIKGSEKVYVNDKVQTVGVDYEYELGTTTYPDGIGGTFTFDVYWENRAFVGIKWKKAIAAGSVIRFEYKNIMKELKIPVKMSTTFPEVIIHKENPESHKYDLAQFISNDLKYVAFKAYWPTLSSYTLDGWMEKFNTIHTPALEEWCNELDIARGEPEVPFSIGQWDFMLDGTYEPQFRGVEVLGLVDYHDADDFNAEDLNADTVKENQVDTEVYWQLQEVFNPWDLNDATGGDPDFGKNSRRLVQYFIAKGGTGSETDLTNIQYFKLQLPLWHHPKWRDESDKAVKGDPNKGGDSGTTQDVDPSYKYGAYSYYWMYCTFAEKVLVDGVLKKPHVSTTPPKQSGQYTIVTISGGVGPYPDGTYIVFRSTAIPAAGAKIKVLYSVQGGVDTFSDYSLAGETWKANWEWIIVGRDSAPVDSAGSGMVTQFFKDKQMPVLWSGLDMQDVTNGPRTPYVMARLRLGDTKDSYKAEDETVPCTGRSTLKDDWCRTVPVKSSNMIGVGGPNANMFTRYFNDFTNAYFESKSTAIRALTCWSKNKYVSTKGTTGYGVISTYKDIDGTVGFLIWGFNGEDTYWTCWWLWHFGWKLQKEPNCVTDIILKFDYTKLDVTAPTSGPWDSTKYKPGFCFWEVVDALGTISEFDFVGITSGGATETKIVFEMTGAVTEGAANVPPGATGPVYSNSLTSVPLPAGTRSIWLWGCWLIDPATGDLAPDLVAVDTFGGAGGAPGGAVPNIVLYHWSSSPFWMCKDTPVPLIKGGWSPSVSYTTGRLSSSTAGPTAPYYLCFNVKQPPIHPCGQLANLPAPG